MQLVITVLTVVVGRPRRQNRASDVLVVWYHPADQRLAPHVTFHPVENGVYLDYTRRIPGFPLTTGQMMREAMGSFRPAFIESTNVINGPINRVVRSEGRYASMSQAERTAIAEQLISRATWRSSRHSAAASCGSASVRVDAARSVPGST